jgi:copper chaperone CopZ
MKIPIWVLAPVVIVSFLGVVLAANLWELPTQQHRFGETATETRDVEMIVDGLRCRGTSSFFLNKLSGVDGLISVNTFVQEHRADISYDPSKISIEEIKKMIEAPVRLRDGRIVRPFTVRDVRE